MKTFYKWFVLKCIYPFVYKIGTIRKIKNKKIIFVENHLDYVSNNYVCLRPLLEKNGYSITTHFLQTSVVGRLAVIGKTIRLMFDMADARCVFITESNSAFGTIPLRKGTDLVQLWHACGAFKKWGFSVADKSFGDSLNDLQKYSGHCNYTLVPVSGEAVCFAYEEAFGLEAIKQIVRPLGVSRTDIFFDEQQKIKAYDKLKQSNINLDGKKIVLYAPTFRGNIKDAKAPAFDYDLFYEKFHKDYILLIKQHPFVKQPLSIRKEYDGEIVDVTFNIDIEDLLMVADICITDYSSVVFEYSLMNRPILFYAYDLASYYDERGFYYPYEAFVPGPIVKTMEDLVEALLDIDKFDYKTLKRFRETYMSGCDGTSTLRILNSVLEDF